MSYSKDVYVGVYIECKNELVPAIRNLKECCGEFQDRSANFCYICGKPLEFKKVKGGLESKINLKIPEELEDVMIDINQQGLEIDKDIYISNSDIGRIEEVELSDIKVFEIYNLSEIPNHNKPVTLQCIDNFLENKDCYAFLQLCIDIYGAENVNLKFGTIVYYM